MKSESPLFDRIRVARGEDGAKPSARPSARPAATEARCEHPGCAGLGEYRAPKGRGREGQYWRFCLEHVRLYNSTYNYFAGLPDDAVASFQKSAVVGHRPTWPMGAKSAAARETGARAPDPWAEAEPVAPGVADPFDVLRETRFRARADAETPRRATVQVPERRAFEALGLEPHAGAEEIKVRYKELVKRFHPDANGGDRSKEERFREIVQAYAKLKAAGFCT